MNAPPASIIVYPAERIELDFGYIDAVASDVSSSLRRGVNAEAAYQPGDGTFYGLVFVPLRTIETARPRVKDGQVWDAHAVRGMEDTRPIEDAEGTPRPSGMEGINRLAYVPNGYLVCRVEGTCYPLRLGGRSGTIAADYVAEHWQVGRSSALALALLFRAISYHLDQAADDPRPTLSSV